MKGAGEVLVSIVGNDDSGGVRGFSGRVSCLLEIGFPLSFTTIDQTALRPDDPTDVRLDDRPRDGMKVIIRGQEEPDSHH